MVLLRLVVYGNPWELEYLQSYGLSAAIVAVVVAVVELVESTREPWQQIQCFSQVH
jgi:hypothetical protein